MNLNNIRKIISGPILKNEPMSRHTSFRTGGPADYFIIPKNPRELAGIIRYFAINNIKYLVIANGTNLLVSDSGIRGAVISLGSHDGTSFTMLGYEETDKGVSIEAGAGCLMGAVGKIAARIGGSGFEELSGIPGCIGGACIMNAGAFGREIGELVASVKAVDSSGTLLKINASDIEFRYRGSSLMDDGLVVTGAEIMLEKGNPSDIEQKSRDFMKRRQESQPLEYPSAGSVFKRPEGYYAGKLISDAGLKGYAIGGARVSEKHAGFIVNTGGASSADVYRLMLHCRRVVYESCGVMLEPELRIIGDFGPQETLG